MNKENIDSVISYYDINDEWYHKQCYACMIVMDASAEELFHQSIYPFVTSVAWLCVYQLHQRNMEEHHFNESQQSIHKTRTKCFQRISFKGIGTDTYNTDSLGNLFYQCTSFESWMIIVWICWFTHNADSYSSG